MPTNAEKYKTAEERTAAYKKFKDKYCHKCKYRDECGILGCKAYWLARKDK